MIKSAVRHLSFCFLLLCSTPLLAQNVLLLNDPCGGSDEYGPVALANLGLGFTEVDDWEALQTALETGPPWELVIVDSYANSHTVANETALIDYINGGGRVLLAYWNLGNGPALAAALDASTISNYMAPVPIQVWDDTAQLFNEPNAVSGPLSPADDTCDVDGQRLEPTAGGEAVAGYTGAPSANEAAIVIGNGGRTVLLGFIPGLFGPEIVDLYENSIAQALGITEFETDIPTIPTLSPLGLVVLLLALTMLGAAILRRRDVARS